MTFTITSGDTPQIIAKKLAALSNTDERTCARAMTLGLKKIRTIDVRDRIAFAARKLGVKLP